MCCDTGLSIYRKLTPASNLQAFSVRVQKIREERSAADSSIFSALRISEYRLLSHQLLQLSLARKMEIVIEVWRVSKELHWSLFEMFMTGLHHVRRWIETHKPGQRPRVPDILYGATHSGILHARLINSFIIIDRALEAIASATADLEIKEEVDAALRAWDELEVFYRGNDSSIRQLGVHFSDGRFQETQRQLAVAVSSAIRVASALCSFDRLLERLRF
jgi:hypothetical protein